MLCDFQTGYARTSIQPKPNKRVELTEDVQHDERDLVSSGPIRNGDEDEQQKRHCSYPGEPLAVPQRD
ncbi:uncharacterized protein N7506_003232 [Penicillium brevicompactum]|uniref:uncharacterized protein n=1 Tax=Penicillium brevicompactum TaxID=5074 RepID=UPI0025414A1E|nr:uncharacterized protein N7506_003232 [Penicillium brevicompactum]KAJ5343408.1 hypothetical protein N7506_003232 [Penicillium brevicompactum]